MKSLFHVLSLFVIGLFTLEVNAQTNNYNNGVFTPTTSEERQANELERQRQVRLNNLPNPYSSEPNTTNSNSNSNSNQYQQNNKNEYYPNLAGDKLIPFKDYYSNKYGFADEYHQVVIKATFCECSIFKNGYAHVATLNKNGVKVYSYIDTQGNTIVPSPSSVNIYSTNFNIEEENNRYGVKNRKGLPIVPFIYYKISPLKNGIACVQGSSSLWGGINESGSLVIPMIYYNEFYFNIDGIAKVEKVKGVKYTGFINNKGKEIIPCQYYQSNDVLYQKDFIILQDSLSKYGVMDNSGKIKTPFLYTEITPLKNGFAYVKEDGKWGAIDITGKLVVPALYNRYLDEFEFVDGYAIVYLDGERATIDTQGKLIKYKKVGDFHEGMACIEGLEAKTFNKFGYIDSLGNIAIPCIYAMPADFHEGLAAVALWDPAYHLHHGYINTKNETILPFIYESAHDFQNGKAYVQKGSKYMYIDKTGKKYKEKK